MMLTIVLYNYWQLIRLVLWIAYSSFLRIFNLCVCVCVINVFFILALYKLWDYLTIICIINISQVCGLYSHILVFLMSFNIHWNSIYTFLSVGLESSVSLQGSSTCSKVIKMFPFFFCMEWVIYIHFFKQHLLQRFSVSYWVSLSTSQFIFFLTYFIENNVCK